MPMFDFRCECGWEDEMLTKAGDVPPCPQCGKPTTKFWTSTAAVIDDTIIGGIEIRHGLCNADGSPHRYYSKSEIAREAKRRGLVNRVEHIEPNMDTGKSKSHTKRWF